MKIINSKKTNDHRLQDQLEHKYFICVNNIAFVACALILLCYFKEKKIKTKERNKQEKKRIIIEKNNNNNSLIYGFPKRAQEIR